MLRSHSTSQWSKSVFAIFARGLSLVFYEIWLLVFAFQFKLSLNCFEQRWLIALYTKVKVGPL